jgi:hypothetical protein
MFARFAIALALITCALYAASAQTPRPADTADAAVAALVAELRLVRQDLAESAQRNLRFQLLLARLQLQEQRIGHLDRQRAEVARTVMDAATMTTMFTTQFEQFRRGCENASGDERKACEGQLETMKATAGSHQAREQQLRTQEQELLQAIATEQGRWADFSARLDELERTLSRPQ